MPKLRTKTDGKNLISTRLKELRESHGLSHRGFSPRITKIWYQYG